MQYSQEYLICVYSVVTRALCESIARMCAPFDKAADRLYVVIRSSAHCIDHRVYM